LFCFLASASAGAQEAFQVLNSCGNQFYGLYYLLMFAVPLVVGTRFGPRPGVFLQIACVSGIAVTLGAMAFNLIPIVDVANPRIFALKVGLAAIACNLIGTFIYWRGTRARDRAERKAEARAADRS